jgi:hypothetical protein
LAPRIAASAIGTSRKPSAVPIWERTLPSVLSVLSSSRATKRWPPPKTSAETSSPVSILRPVRAGGSPAPGERAYSKASSGSAIQRSPAESTARAANSSPESGVSSQRYLPAGEKAQTVPSPLPERTKTSPRAGPRAESTAMSLSFEPKSKEPGDEAPGDSSLPWYLPRESKWRTWSSPASIA